MPRLAELETHQKLRALLPRNPQRVVLCAAAPPEDLFPQLDPFAWR